MAKPAPLLTDFGDKPPILYTMTNDQYHAANGVSRSELWKLWKKRPAHVRFGKRVETSPMKLGSAAGAAILEPDDFEKRYARGPGNDTRLKTWKDAAAAAPPGVTMLKENEFDAALCMRESAHATSSLRKLITGARIEQAAFAVDETTGLLVKVKPDLYNPALKIVADIKTSNDASPEWFAKTMASYGYHVQEAFYSDVWKQLLPVDAFVFIVIESEVPYLAAQYELPPRAAAEGREICRQALALYAECKAKDEWPGYPDKVVPIDLPRWGYQATQPSFD